VSVFCCSRGRWTGRVDPKGLTRGWYLGVQYTPCEMKFDRRRMPERPLGSEEATRTYSPL
jgi:hypothetical protein